MILLHRLYTVEHRMAKIPALAFVKEILHRLAHPALVVLDRQHVVAASVHYLRRHLLLAPLRRWSHEEVSKFSPRCPRACRSHSAGTLRRARVVVGRNLLDRCQNRLLGRNASLMGA